MFDKFKLDRLEQDLTSIRMDMEDLKIEMFKLQQELNAIKARLWEEKKP